MDESMMQESMNSFGDKLMDFIKSYAEWLVVAAGILLLLGAILNWKWVTRPLHNDRYKYEKRLISYRMRMGLLGAGFIIIGVVMVFYLRVYRGW